MEQIDERDLEELPIKRRPQAFEPRTRYDFCMIIASMLKKPVGYVLGRTKGFPMSSFFQMQSDCKQLKTPEQKSKYLMWFLRESKTKEI